MGLDLENIWTKLQKMPAVFVSGLQYGRKSGFINDYFNIVNSTWCLYKITTSGWDEKYSKEKFARHLLKRETYHDYLERKLDLFNDWLGRDSNAVQIFSLEDGITQSYIGRGYSSEIRPVGYDEFMDALYHEKARELNKFVRELRYNVGKQISDGLTFDQMDHRYILTSLKDIQDFQDKEHRFNDVNKMMNELGLIDSESPSPIAL
jgi:hypothetical protein